MTAWSRRFRKSARVLRRIEIARDAAAHIARRILMESTTRRGTESDPASDLPSEYDLNTRSEKREQNQYGRILRTHRSPGPFRAVRWSRHPRSYLDRGYHRSRTEKIMSDYYPAGAPRIAIIGAGMAGCSAAYFLREIFGDELAIVVFEKAQQVGGRVQRRTFAGTAIETGATLIHSSNAYLSAFIETLGLQRARPHDREDSKSSALGIWNGTAFAFQSLPSSGATTVRMLARYGLAPLRTRALVRSMLERWTRIYELQQQQRAYATPRAMFEALDLFPWTQQVSYTMFQQNRISRRFVDEFIDGVSRVNYGQDGTIHAFVNLTSLV